MVIVWLLYKHYLYEINPFLTAVVSSQTSVHILCEIIEILGLQGGLTIISRVDTVRQLSAY